MKLNLAAIVAAAGDCQLEARPEEINLVPPKGYDVEFVDPVLVRLTTRRVGEEYFASGQAETSGRFTCVRCLEQFEARLETALELVIHRVMAPQPTDPEPDNYVEVPLGTSVYDAGPHVRDGLLVALPQAPHCREECRGLCARCGVNLNEKTCTCKDLPADPRWADLKQFAK
jgi:uncharacterized protein